MNAALAANPAFTRSVAALRSNGVQVLLGPGEFESHPAGTGGSRIDAFPGTHLLFAARRLSAH